MQLGTDGLQVIRVTTAAWNESEEGFEVMSAGVSVGSLLEENGGS